MRHVLGLNFFIYPTPSRTKYYLPPRKVSGVNTKYLMDISYLLRVLGRRKWLILSLILASGIATYVLVGRQPEKYKSRVILSTGIVNYKGINSSGTDGFVQEFQIQNAFSNLLEFINSRSNVKMLTLAMLQHDMPGGATYKADQAYTLPNKEISNFTDEQARQLLSDINNHNIDSIGDPTFSTETDDLIDKISRAYGYDHDAILRCIEIKRKGETDNLMVNVTTSNPKQTQYMANTFAKVFMSYYQSMRQRENKKKVDFYQDLVGEKFVIIDSLKEQLYDYRKSKGLASPDKQAEELIGQITQLELQLQRASSKEQASNEASGRLDDYNSTTGAVFADETRSRVVDKNLLFDQKKKVDELRQKSISGSKKDPNTEKELAKAELDYEAAVRFNSGSVGKIRPKEEERAMKQDIFKERINSDLEGIDAKKNAGQIRQEIGLLKPKLGGLVASDQTMSYIKTDLERKETEFDKLNDELNKFRLAYQTNENPLQVIDNAQLPEWPEGNNQLLLSIFAGIVAATLTTLVLFLLTYFDDSLQSPVLFKGMTDGLPLAGAVNQIGLKGLDLKQVFQSNGNARDMNTFRESLRKIRNEILTSPGRIFLVVSTKQNEGKSFTINALAHALAANHKRTLIIDTNFKNPTLSKFAAEPSAYTSVINHAIRNANLSHVFAIKTNTVGMALGNVEVIGNTGLYGSPDELLNANDFRNFLVELRESFDYIFMEAAAMNQYSDARELVHYADRVFCVFSADSKLAGVDQDQITYLKELEQKFSGAILTQVDLANMN
jgi:polysaccharide biosynthesis transport protein